FLILFLFTLRRRPRSTLFPYTTLFRSCNVLGDYAPLQQSPWTSVCISLALELSTWYQVHTRLRGPSPGAGSRIPTYGFGDRRASDRKSTRLNSSHVKISYAVFCLKKKK